MSSNRDYRDFDASAIVSKLNFNTVNLHDYQMLGDELARVVVSYTGDISGEEFRSRLSKMFDGLASPIRNSFRKLTPNSVLGWVSANKEIREYSEVEEGKKYRALASNILMDREDQTTWELKETESGGKYLCRQGIEDLSEIASTLFSRRVGVPLLTAIASAETAEREFVAFVNTEEADMDYGYVVGIEENGDKEVLSAVSHEKYVINPLQVVHATNLDKEDVKAWGKEFAANGDKSAMIEYYKKAYKHSPDYIRAVIDTINQHSFA